MIFRGFLIGLMIAVGLTVTEINQGFFLSGEKYRPQHLSLKTQPKVEITPYRADTSNILGSLQLFKSIYYVGGIVHGVYLGLH